MKKHMMRTVPVLLLAALFVAGIASMGPGAVEAQGPGMVQCPDGSYSSAGICPTINLDYGGSNVTLSFSGSPTTITSGQSATLSWTSSGAISCESSDFAVPYDTYTTDQGTFTMGKANGSTSVSPTATKTYSITCSGLGINFAGSTETRSVTITVTGAPNTPTTPTVTTPTNDPTSNGFSSIFQIDNDADHSSVYATIPVETVDLASGASTPASTVYAFPYAGTWHARACGDQPPYPNGAVSETSEANNCTSWQTFLISDPASPNLVAGSVYAGGAVRPGVATTLYSNTYNNGTGATGGNSVTAFQRANDALGTGAVTIGYYTVGNIAAGGNQQASTGYTFPSAATWYMRSCVDWNGQIAESDEGNCGAWEPMVVAAVCSNGIDDDGDGATDYPADSGCSGPDDMTDGPNLPTASLSVSAAVITLGNSSTLTWSSTGGATSCTAVDASGQFATGGATSGNDPVTPASAGVKTYGVYCSNSSGNSPTAYRDVTVISPSAYITAQPTSVDARGAGGSTNLLWSAVDATTCDIDRSQGTPAKVLDDVVPSGTTTTAVSGITRQTRFTITCQTTSGSTPTNFVIVNPIPTEGEF